MSVEYDYEQLIETLRARGEVHTPLNSPNVLFLRLGLPLPKRPEVIIQTLESTGKIVVDMVDDDETQDPRTPSGKFCNRYRAN